MSVVKPVICTEEIDNKKSTGAVRLGGGEYNARSSHDNIIIHVGERVSIVDWEGNKIIGKPYKEPFREKVFEIMWWIIVIPAIPVLWILKKFFNWEPKDPPIP